MAVGRLWFGLLAFSSGLAGFGCQPPAADGDALLFDPCEPLSLRVIDASRSELGSVVQAAALWNDAAGTALEVRVEADADASDATEIPVVFESAAPFFYGQYDHELGAVYVNHDLPNDAARTITVAHELGHAFGLVHVSEETRASLMNGGNLDQPLTDADVAELRALWGACAPAP